METISDSPYLILTIEKIASIGFMLQYVIITIFKIIKTKEKSNVIHNDKFNTGKLIKNKIGMLKNY